jgi:hypothetical protein
MSDDAASRCYGKPMAEPARAADGWRPWIELPNGMFVRNDGTNIFHPANRATSPENQVHQRWHGNKQNTDK